MIQELGQLTPEDLLIVSHGIGNKINAGHTINASPLKTHGVRSEA